MGTTQELGLINKMIDDWLSKCLQRKLYLISRITIALCDFEGQELS
jgi:hypothetical protein